MSASMRAGGALGSLAMVLACGGLGAPDPGATGSASAGSQAPSLQTRDVAARAFHTNEAGWTSLQTADDTVVAVRQGGHLHGLSPIAVVPLTESQPKATGAWVQDGQAFVWDGRGALKLDVQHVDRVHANGRTVALVAAGHGTCRNLVTDKRADLKPGSVVVAGYDACCSGSGSGRTSCVTVDGRAFDGPPVGAELAVGWTFACSLDSAGRLDCAGEGAPAPPEGVGYRAVSIGSEEHVCAVDAQGELVCWGKAAPTRYTISGIGYGADGKPIEPAPPLTDVAVVGDQAVVLTAAGRLFQVPL